MDGLRHDFIPFIFSVEYLLSMPLGTGESRKTLLEQSGDSHGTKRIDVSILE